MLPDVLEQDMKIVFCGPVTGDRFWIILHKTGLTPTRLAPGDYRSMRSYGLGLVDSDYESLTEKIRKFIPQILCFNGKNTAKKYLKHRNIDFGWQAETIGSTRIFVVPSTSGSANRYWDEKWWFLLADSICSNVKKINPENYYKPDGIYKLKINEADFLKAVSNIELHYSIPLDVRNMFEIAKALFAYGYLYYPFCTLAIEQALKTLEAVISLKFDALGGYQVNSKGLPPVLADKINYLYSKGLISKAQKEILHDCRHLRNMAFHPKYQQTLGHYDEALRMLAQLMDEIWLKK